MKIVFFIVTISLLFAFHCSAIAQEAGFARKAIITEYGSIKGKVTDTNTPRANNIVSANVVVESELILGNETKIVKTDSEGNYEIYNLPPGEYVVTVSKRRYDRSVDYVTVTPGEGAFHNVRLYKTDTTFTLLLKMKIIWGVLLLCFVFVVIYTLRRRSFKKVPNG